MDEREYRKFVREGWNANFAGLSDDACPYTGEQAAAWIDGWTAAETSGDCWME